MTEAEIIEANGIIAGFLNADYCEYPGDYFPGQFGYTFKNFNPNHLQPEAKSCWWNENSLAFHKSWDWLKPVIDKIFTYALAYPEQVDKIRNTSIVVEIKAAHKMVFDFIQWYNTQTKS